MGNKKKNSGKHQGKGGETNHDQGSSHSHSFRGDAANHNNSSPKGRSDRQGKPMKSGQDSSSSSHSTSSVPESRLPWRLILLVSILAGGVAIVCVNEPVKSVIEDFYLRHAEAQILQISQALGMTQGNTASGSTPSREEAPAKQTRSQESSPRAKRDSPDSTPTHSTTTPPPEKPSQEEPDLKPSAVELEKPSTQLETMHEDATLLGNKPSVVERDAEKKAERQSRVDEKESMTAEKAVPTDTPTIPVSGVKQETPTQPVVEEIKVKTTPKADRDEKTGVEKPQTEKPMETAQPKPEEKAAEKPAKQDTEKHVEKGEQKPAPKSTAEKADSKPTEGKTQEKSEQTSKRAAEENSAASGTDDGKPPVSQEPSAGVMGEGADRDIKSDYDKANITNGYDYKIRDKLDEAEDLLQQGNIEEALRRYEQLLSKYPKSPRAMLGRADSLDKLAFKKRSNEVLEQCILGYESLIYHGEDVVPVLMKMAGHRLAKKQQFRGWGAKAARTLTYLSHQFPEDIQLQKELGVTHLLVGQIDEAEQVFERILESHPDDGYSLAHLGFIVKTSRQDPERGIPLLKRGIDSGHPGTEDGRFFFQLGDAYQRLGREREAREVYEAGAKKGLFLSADQRSLYNVNRLKSRPWWTKEQTGYQEYLKLLEDNWEIIRDEALQQLDTNSSLFKNEAESLREKGSWKQLTMYQQGHKNSKVCANVPKTCELIEKIPDAKGCKRGQVKFSVIHPGTHVWPHCGPTNCRIRAHLGLVVPKGVRIRVVNETRSWEEGKFIILDDSFEHEVWHEGDSVRLILIVDFWHPNLTAEEKRTLVPI